MIKINEVFTNLKNDKKALIIFFAGIFGIFLLLISNFSYNDSIDTNNDKTIIESADASLTTEQIEEKLEARLSTIISQISGAGNSTVMVSIASAGEYVYAKNDSSKNDTDSSATENEIVIYDSGDGDSGLVISIKSPDVLGVAIICEGGGSAIIKSEITNLVTSLFGIGSDRVYVGVKS